MSTIIGDNIAKYRKLNGMSQKHLANVVGISQQGLWKIEKGVASPTAGTIEKFVAVLCVTPNQLFGLEQMEESNISILARIKQEEEGEGR